MEQPEVKTFLSEDVLCEARKRVSLIFDNFQNIIVSISGGKDSTALFWLAVEEAVRRGRKIRAFFLDQEAEYLSTIKLIQIMMGHPNVEPLWFQVPLSLTNATSYSEEFFRCWEEGKEWLRSKNEKAIKCIEEKYPDRFYKFFNWLEQKSLDTAFLIGIRAEESINRFRAVTSNPGWSGIKWSTKTKGRNTFRFYPIYDWSYGDVWKFIKDENLPYNTVYDKMYQANKNFYKTMRVSNLIHEKSFKCLTDLQLYELETFNKLVKRISGVHVASIYAREKTVFNSTQLPAHFSSWKLYRDYLLNNTPLEHKSRFVDRFSNQSDTENMYRKQVRQLLLNDHENNLAVQNNNKSKKRKDLYNKLWDVL